jgi:hypothetical protein
MARLCQNIIIRVNDQRDIRFDMDFVYQFLSAIEDDPRITTAHISLYMALWKKWKDSGSGNSVCFYRGELVAVCKLSSYNCYHKKIRELHEYGYIKYVPSYNHFLGSLVWFIEVKK